MIPKDVMVYVAALFPIASFVVGFVTQYLWKNGWISTLVVFVGSFLAMMFVFSLHFWSWLLLYLFICWLGNWAGHAERTRKATQRKSSV